MARWDRREKSKIRTERSALVLKTLLAWLCALGMTVLAVMLFITSVDAPSNGEEALATFGAFASCCCALGFFILGSALRPSVNDQVHIKPRQHAFTNPSASADSTAGMVADFTSGRKGGENANKLSAALAEHYGTFGMGYDVRVVGEERTSHRGEHTVVDMGSYHVAPSTTFRDGRARDDDEEDAPDITD